MESAAQCDQECRIAGWRDFSERHKRACRAAASAWAGTMTVHAPRFLNRTGIKVVNLTPVSPVLRCRAAAPACWISFMLPLFPCAQLAADSAGSQLTGPLLPARFAPLDVDALLAQLHPLNE